MDSATPTAGWNRCEVRESSKRASKAKHDDSGHLYFFVRDILSAFYTRVQSQNVSFVVTASSAEKLQEILPADLKFDRIEVANIMDIGYLGPDPSELLCAMRPLLNPSNKYATLLTLFLNAVPLTHQLISLDRQHVRPLMMQALGYLRLTRPPLTSSDPIVARLIAAQNFFLPVDELFNAYAEGNDFNGAARKQNMLMKQANTVIQAWPHRLKKKLGEEGPQEGFRGLESSGLMGWERYVEWQLA